MVEIHWPTNRPRQSTLRLQRQLRYRLSGKSRWHVEARNKHAYVWQIGPFAGDVDYWQKGLSQPGQIEPVNKGGSLRFSLYTDEDFKFFKSSATKELQSVEWESTPSELDDGDLVSIEN